MIFFVELWERFGYYGVQGILAVFFVKQLGFSQEQAFITFGAFAALVYGLISIGGYVGDHLLGTKRTLVLGAIVLAIGYFMTGMSLLKPQLIFIALGTIAVGNGLFKANPASLLPKCYPPKDARLDGAFTLFYMSINIGSLLSLSLAPVIAEKFGYAVTYNLCGAGLIIALLVVFDIPYEDYNQGGAIINLFLGPATACLAVTIYSQMDLLKKNLLPILAGCVAGTATAVFSILGMCRFFGLDSQLTISLLPKSVTTAISMDVAAELGGIAALTGAIVILTGIAGNLLAETVCKVFHITDPIAKGVGIGTSAHAVGTSKALQMGEVEGAMSGLSIAVAGVLTAVLCPIFVNFIG